MTTVTAQEMTGRIGTEQVSDWVEVSQEMIDKFADATGDHQFIHVNPQMAAMTPFGGTIAHGFLTLSLMPLLSSKIIDPVTIDGVKMGINYGGNKVRFLQPVRSDRPAQGNGVIARHNGGHAHLHRRQRERQLNAVGRGNPRAAQNTRVGACQARSQKRR